MKNQWLDKQEYPFTSKYIPVNGRQLHYVDEGVGEVILFVHGTPSWSFDFRNVIRILSKDYRCIAIDHIGFGLSDKPEHYDYTTINHSKTLRQFISRLQLTDITMVVHDFGGPIGMNVALTEPDMFKRIVVLNSWLWNSTADPGFRKFSKVLRTPILPFLYRYLNFSARFVMPASFGHHKLSKRTLTQYTRPFAGKTQRNGPLAFVRSLLNDQEWFEELWNKRERIQTKPILFIWGMKDPVVGPQYLEKFISGFPGAVVEKLEHSGHFPQEERPEEVTAYISSFMKPKTVK